MLCGSRHVTERVGVRAEAARRIGDVAVDFGRVAAQPVEVRPPLERFVPRHPIEGGVGNETPEDRVDRGRPRQHRGHDLVTVVEQVLLQRERAHRVPEQDTRRTAAAGIDGVADGDEVGDQRIPTIRPEAPELVRAANAAPVAAMVVRVDVEAGRAERGGEPRVATGVLAQAVRDLYDGPHCATPGPVPDEQLHVATAWNGEGRLRHQPRLARRPRAVRVAPSAGFEPAHMAPEATALSPELRGRTERGYQGDVHNYSDVATGREVRSPQR